MYACRLPVLAHEVEADPYLDGPVQNIPQTESEEEEKRNGQKDCRVKRRVDWKSKHVDQNLHGLEPFVVGNGNGSAVSLSGIPRHADNATETCAQLLQRLHLDFSNVAGDHAAALGPGDVMRSLQTCSFIQEILAIHNDLLFAGEECGNLKLECCDLFMNHSILFRHTVDQRRYGTSGMRQVLLDKTLRRQHGANVIRLGTQVRNDHVTRALRLRYRINCNESAMIQKTLDSSRHVQRRYSTYNERDPLPPGNLAEIHWQ